MDKIQLLEARKTAILEAGKEIREQISSLVDADSFVELSAFSFSKNTFAEADVAGEGVVTGFATVEGYPFYVVAQNFKVLQGGMSKANCDKIVKCMDIAAKDETPIIYLMNTYGVQVGEGVGVLEGLGKFLMRASQLKGVVPQYVVVNGEVYGSAAILAAVADAVLFVDKKSVLALNSPFVLSAKEGKNLSKEEVGGVNALAKSGLASVAVASIEEAKEKIVALYDILSARMLDADLNGTLPQLNESATAENMLSVFDSYVELGAGNCDCVKTLLGRIGGISVAAVLFDGGEEGVELKACNLAKIRSFTEYAGYHSLPLVMLCNVKGVAPTMCANNSRVMKEVVEYLEYLDAVESGKISVVYGKAIGLGYTLFASKSVGFDYTCAFANAKIALFDSVQGAQIELGGEGVDKAALAAKYADENANPFNAAQGGYIDAIIEPQFVRQYLIASLQMLVK